jgi:hypothetical protein
MIDLNQLLKAEKRYKRFDDQHPRSYERHSLESAVGSMRYRGVQVSCQVLDISMGGCCIETERLFDIGALAHVEIEISIFGLNLRIVGVIQWTEDNLIGVRFFHPGVKTKNQVASIISCLIDHGTIESVQAALAAAEAQKPGK